MDLARDFLDKKVVDRHGREMGRVDSVVLRIERSGRPHVIAIELGPAVLAHRVHPVLGRWVAALEHAFGVDEGRPVRIPIGSVLGVSDHVKVDLAFGETGAATVEQRLRRWIASIPGSR